MTKNSREELELERKWLWTKNKKLVELCYLVSFEIGNDKRKKENGKKEEEMMKWQFTMSFNLKRKELETKRIEKRDFVCIQPKWNCFLQSKTNKKDWDLKLNRERVKRKPSRKLAKCSEDEWTCRNQTRKQLTKTYWLRKIKIIN